MASHFSSVFVCPGSSRQQQPVPTNDLARRSEISVECVLVVSASPSCRRRGRRGPPAPCRVTAWRALGRVWPRPGIGLRACSRHHLHPRNIGPGRPRNGAWRGTVAWRPARCGFHPRSADGVRPVCGEGRSLGAVAWRHPRRHPYKRLRAGRARRPGASADGPTGLPDGLPTCAGLGAPVLGSPACVRARWVACGARRQQCRRCRMDCLPRTARSANRQDPARSFDASPTKVTVTKEKEIGDCLFMPVRGHSSPDGSACSPNTRKKGECKTEMK